MNGDFATHSSLSISCSYIIPLPHHLFTDWTGNSFTTSLRGPNSVERTLQFPALLEKCEESLYIYMPNLIQLVTFIYNFSQYGIVK